MALKKKKYPKKPKASANLSVWERYQNKVKDVNAYNNQLIKDKTKKENIIKSVDKLKK
jgi:hypothetical protein